MREHPEHPIFGPEDPRLDPPNPPEIRPARSIAKAISWRAVGTLDTLLLSFVILSLLGPFFGLEEASAADRVKTAASIALTEVATKMTLYYLHERFWSRLHWDRTLDEEGHHRDGRRRSATKTATWRAVWRPRSRSAGSRSSRSWCSISSTSATGRESAGGSSRGVHEVRVC